MCCFRDQAIDSSYATQVINAKGLMDATITQLNEQKKKVIFGVLMTQRKLSIILPQELLFSGIRHSESGILFLILNFMTFNADASLWWKASTKCMLCHV